MLHLARTALNILKINLLISFPSWLTLWKDAINPQWPVHYSDYYTFIVLLLIEIVQFNSSVSEIESGTAYGKKKQSKNTEIRKKKPQVNFNELLQWALKCVCVHTFISHIIFFYFFIRTGTEASLFWASLVLVLDILCSVLHRFWLFYLKGL